MKQSKDYLVRLKKVCITKISYSPIAKTNLIHKIKITIEAPIEYLLLSCEYELVSLTQVSK